MCCKKPFRHLRRHTAELLDLTPEEFASLIGSHRATLDKWDNNEHIPRSSTSWNAQQFRRFMKNPLAIVQQPSEKREDSREITKTLANKPGIQEKCDTVSKLYWAWIRGDDISRLAEESADVMLHTLHVQLSRQHFTLMAQNDDCNDILYSCERRDEFVEHPALKVELEWVSRGNIEITDGSHIDFLRNQENLRVLGQRGDALRIFFDTDHANRANDGQFYLSLNTLVTDDLQPGYEDLSIKTLEGSKPDKMEIIVDYTQVDYMVFAKEPKAELLDKHGRVIGKNIEVKEGNRRKGYRTWSAFTKHPDPGSCVRLSWRHLLSSGEL